MELRRVAGRLQRKRVVLGAKARKLLEELQLLVLAQVHPWHLAGAVPKRFGQPARVGDGPVEMVGRHMHAEPLAEVENAAVRELQDRLQNARTHGPCYTGACRARKPRG